MRADTDTHPVATLLKQLAGSLNSTLTAFEGTTHRIPRVFTEYTRVRATYHEIQAMIFTINDKAQEKPKHAPPELKSWLTRMRLRAIAAFAKISLEFFRNPPLLLVQALGAYEILDHERHAFTAVLRDYDNMLLEAAVDDKTADELDRVRTYIEEVVQLLDKLLHNAPPQLRTF
ncbi:MAG TPA: hypothetical protein VED40_05010 [Azospirillaceae bacterium]|nr:hypothetical protein [Azospirillaceae bacterium]